MRLIWWSAAWAAGIAAGLWGDAPPASLGMLAAASLLIALLLRRLHAPLWAMLPAILLIAGILRVEVADPEGMTLARFHGAGTVEVVGVVDSDPEATRSAVNFRLRVERISGENGTSNATAMIHVTAHAPESLAQRRDRPFFRYGDRLRLNGRLAPPPEVEDFDFPSYLARQGIHTVMSFAKAELLSEGHGNPMRNWLYSARRRLGVSIASVVPEPQASIGQALLLGLRHNLSEDTTGAFRFTGASHILAISGLHVGVLLGVSIAASQAVFGLRRQLYLVAPMAVIWGYTLLAGAPVSAVRAAVMGTVLLAALALGRPRSTLPALAFAGAVMAGVDPGVLRSLSFQLSFAAMAGIALWAEPIAVYLGGRPRVDAARPSEPRLLRRLTVETAAATIAATAATLPLVAFYFKSVPLLGLPATLLVLPAVPAVLVTHGLTALTGLFGGVAVPFGWTAWLVTGYIDRVVQTLSLLPAASIETGQIGPALIWVYYGSLAAAHIAVSRLSSMRLRMLRPAVVAPGPVPSLRLAGWTVLALLITTGLLCLAAVQSRPDGRLRVSVLDVGQGDAILISSPGGGQILVDGGPDGALLADLLGSRMPFRDRTIELVVLTHPHSDHLAGLTEVLRRYDVEVILEPEIDYGSSDYAEWRRLVAGEGSQTVSAHAGQTIDLGGGAYATVVSPPASAEPLQVNDASVGLRVVFGNASFLLTGDMYATAERAALARGEALDSDVLKVAHHGSRTSSSEAFLRAVGPVAAVASAGEDNSHGHPHDETVARLMRHVPEEMLFVTSRAGTVEFETDGQRIVIRTAR